MVIVEYLLFLGGTSFPYETKSFRHELHFMFTHLLRDKTELTTERLRSFPCTATNSKLILSEKGGPLTRNLYHFADVVSLLLPKV